MSFSSCDLLEEPGVVPFEAAAAGFSAYPDKLFQRGLELARFPPRDGRLPSMGYGRHLHLGDLEDFATDTAQLVHTNSYIPKRMRLQPSIQRVNWPVNIPSGIVPRMDVRSVLRKLMIARGWTQEVLADELDTAQATISRWLAGREPRGRAMERIRELALESGVIDREPVAANQAPLVGRVGAGAEIEVEHEQAPPEGYDLVELPFSFADPVIAFEVAGDSMLPVYEPGEVIVCLRDQVRSADSYLGKRVVVKTVGGRRFIKRLMRGSRKGFYNLDSWNALTIEDVRLEWVGEIVATVPSRAAVRQVERAPRKRAAAQ
ncbi:repressor protein CI [Microcystis phage Mwe-Yong1]|nr:repressor protein CI [Microcystis phage Mwe-Yong1]